MATPNLATKHANYISRYAQVVQSVLKDADALLALRAEWDSLNYTVNITDADFTGGNAYINAAILASAVVSAQAVTDLLAANGNAHRGNLEALIP